MLSRLLHPGPTQERWLVLLIAVHSLAVGVMLLAAPQWAIRFGGWDHAEPSFFVRQAGVFHVVLVIGYLIEHLRYQGVLLLVSAKSTAVVFLVAASLLDQVPWAVPISAAGDGAMALLAWLVHRRVAAARVRPGRT
jgi:hypothetical protein